jgi:hypothetical protein
MDIRTIRSNNICRDRLSNQMPKQKQGAIKAQRQSLPGRTFCHQEQQKFA